MIIPPVIAALDLSLTTGWCVGAPLANAPPAGGVWKLGKMRDKYGSRLGEIGSSLMRCVEDLIAAHRPALVVFEAPIGKVQTTARLFHSLGEAVEIACYEAGVPCREEAPHTVRKLVLGRGMFPKPMAGQGRMVLRTVKGEKVRELRGDPKEEVMLWCRREGLAFVDDNHADALLLHRYACILARSRVTAGAGAA